MNITIFWMSVWYLTYKLNVWNIQWAYLTYNLIIQCGHRYYASTIFRDLQNVFHDIISGDLWEVSSVTSGSRTKGIEFLIKIESLRRKKRKSGSPRLLGKLANFLFSGIRPQIYDGSVVWKGCLWILQHKYTHSYIPACL